MKEMISGIIVFLLQWFVVTLIIGVIVSVLGAGLYITHQIFTHGQPWQLILWVVVVVSFFVTIGNQEG